MQTLAMILAGGAGSRLSTLTQKRAKPAVPFAGKYRIIDFTLSNCVNSGVFCVGVCTQYRPRSLHDHIRSGRPWDLDRNVAGVTLLPPYTGREESDWYQGTADAIYQNLDFIHHYDPDYVVVLAGDHIYKMNYDVLVTFHEEHRADLTVATVRVSPEEATRFGILAADETFRVGSFEEKPARPSGTLASMGIYVFNTRVLEQILHQDHADVRSTHDFGADIVPHMVANFQTYAFPFSGYWVDVGTVAAYWQAHMDLLEDAPRLNLMDRSWVIHTLSEERQPATIRNGAAIYRSLISDGCLIEGHVAHSVLSPGVVVRAGATVRHSVVLTDTVVEPGAILDYTILDKRVHVGANAHLGMGSEWIPGLPANLSDGLTVVGKNTQIPAGVVVGRNCTLAADLTEDAFETHEIPCGAGLGLPAET